MILRRIAAAGFALAAATLTVLSPVAANATTAAHQSRAAAAAATQVAFLGSFPVDCTGTSPNQSPDQMKNLTPAVYTLTCTAQDVSARLDAPVCTSMPIPNDTVADTLRVCSDYQPLIDAAQKQAAVAAAAPAKLDFGCSILDPACAQEQNMSNQIASWISSSLTDLFTLTAFNTSSPLWSTATDEAGFWWTIVGFVVVAGSAIGIAVAAIIGNRRLILRAIGGLLGTFAALFLSIWALGIVLNVIDSLNAPLLAHATADGGLQQTMMKLLFPPDLTSILGAADPLTILGYLVLFAAGLVVIALVDSVRNFGLMVLIAFAPIAFSILGTKPGSTWLRNWTAGVVALVLTKPLTLGLLVLVINGIGNVKSVYSVEALPLGFGLLLCLFMPFVAFSLFSFIGGAAAANFESAGGSARMLGRDSRYTAGAARRGFGRLGGSRGGGVGTPAAGGAAGRRGNPATQAAANSTPSTPAAAGTASAAPHTSGKPEAIRSGRFGGTR